jgi:hypothetical protein
MRELLDPAKDVFHTCGWTCDQAWRVTFGWPEGFGNTIYLKRCSAWLMTQHKNMLEAESTKWIDVDVRASCITLRVAVIWWTLNEALNARNVPVPLDVNHECWKVLVKFAHESHEVYDRVAIVIAGSSETWGMNVHLDAWFDDARTLCAANGIPVFVFSSEVERQWFPFQEYFIAK